MGGIWQHLTINSDDRGGGLLHGHYIDDVGGLLHGNHLDESSIVWPTSTHTINRHKS